MKTKRERYRVSLPMIGVQMRGLIASLGRWWVGLTKRLGDVVDVFRPRGDVELVLIHAHGPRKGQVHRRIKGRNVVTSWLSVGGAAPTSGRDMMRRILVPSGFSGQLSTAPLATISQMELGSGTTAESSSDTALEAPLAPTTKKTITSVTFDALNPYVTFIVEYDETEANATISEACLYSGRDDFIARKTFGAFTKTSDFLVELRWTIRF